MKNLHHTQHTAICWWGSEWNIDMMWQNKAPCTDEMEYLVQYWIVIKDYFLEFWHLKLLHKYKQEDVKEKEPQSRRSTILC